MKLKTKLRGIHFGSNEGAKEAVNVFFEDKIEIYILKGLSKSTGGQSALM
jgi:hypothetical protein